MSDPLVVKDITGVDNKTILDCYKNEFTEESIEKILDALRPHGKWKEQTDYVGDTYYECSVCKEPWTTIEGTPMQNFMNFCPNCGAKMDGGEE